MTSKPKHRTVANADHVEALNKTGFWGKSGAGCLILAKSTSRFFY